MAVTHDDVRHIAELARLSVRPDRLDHLVAELNGILAHMEVLAQVDTAPGDPSVGGAQASTPLRSDAGKPLELATPREDFAPEMRDGFFIVPRLATHDDAIDRAP
jgi:aspartyl-tRNA(Asn)/glutamyl-tRNA(Gln) amidotransferase subunit C